MEQNVVHDNERLLSLLQEAETDLKPVVEDSSDTPLSQASITEYVETRYSNITSVCYRPQK